jgi:hypothetical protein
MIYLVILGRSLMAAVQISATTASAEAGTRDLRLDTSAPSRPDLPG